MPINWPHRSRRRQLAILAGLIICFLLADVLLPSTLDANSRDYIESVLMGVSIGVCIGQINLISVWAALAPGRLVVRLPWALLLTVIMWSAVCLGLNWEGSLADDYYQAGVMLCCAQLAAQTPLWIGARIWDWRLVSRKQIARRDDSPDTQHGIAHMMLGTLFLAVALAVFRYVISGQPVDWSLVRFEPEIIAILVAAVFTNLMIVVPCVWFAFAPLARLRRMLLGWALLVVGVSFVEDVILCVMLGPPPHFAIVFLVTLIINATQCAVVVYTLMKLRRLGFRLVRMRA